MKAYLLIAVGSGLGGVARHWLGTVIASRMMSAFPWGTFVVNVIGAILIGFVLALPESRLSAQVKQFLTVGMLGGFTTFSAFSAQTLQLVQAGKLALASIYAVASVLVCFAGCWLGWALASK